MEIKYFWYLAISFYKNREILGLQNGNWFREKAVIYQLPRRTLNLYDLPVSAETGQFLDSDRFSEMEDGEIGIFFLDGEAYVKKYHQTPDGISLISVNKKYAPIKVSSGSVFSTLGKVVG